MSAQAKLWYFENYNFLEALSMKEKMELAEKAGMRKAPKNQVIYFPEDPSNSIYFLKEGRVKISNMSEEGKEVILAILGPGEVFGEMAVTGEGPRNHIAEATEDTIICNISTEELGEMMALNPKINMQLTKLIGLRFRKIQSRLQNLVFKSAPDRIRAFIKEMVEDHGRKVGHEREVKLSLTHQDIANLTATTRQTVTLVMRELAEKNVILYDRKRILVRDLDALSQPHG